MEKMKTKMDLSFLDSLLNFFEESPTIWMDSDMEEAYYDVSVLKMFLIDPPEMFVADGALDLLKSMASEVESIFSSVDLNTVDLHMPAKLYKTLPHFRSRLYHLIYSHIPVEYGLTRKSSRFHPRVGQVEFVYHLVKNLKELVKAKAEAIGPLEFYVVKLIMDLQFMSSHFMVMPEMKKKQPHLNDIMQRITSSAYEVEYYIDLFMVREIPIWRCMLSLLQIININGYYMQQLRTELGDTQPIVSSVGDFCSPETMLERSNDVVGFEEETGTMLELLTRGPTKLNLVSIFGRSGLGKTTFAKKLYNDVSVVNHFDTRAWCYVSRIYERKKLILELLGHIVPLSDTIRHMMEEELADLLCKSLVGRRFVIVLDDMWSTGAWNNLRRCFPDERNGSRIIFTTRLQWLATEAQSGSVLQPLGRLSDDESWKLLTMKLFEKDSCPLELLEIGTQIVKGCKGLPIAVVLVAGVLAKTEKTKERWTQILESILGDANEHGKGVIELSYMNLPDHLKPCFLYFGQFLTNREVPVSKLIRLLIAEGLIRHDELKSLENVAEGYLMDLIARNLVIVSQEKSKGGVKSCRVHDLIHEFCSTKAEEENFLHRILGYNEHFPSSRNYQDYGMDPTYINSSAPMIYYPQDRRISVYSKRNHFVMLKPSGSKVRSLMFLPASDTFPSYPYDISFVYHNFKLLIILNLEDLNIGNSFEGIDVLVRLRYLSVQGYVDCIPSSIANLSNLETFLVKGIQAKVVEVPDAICDMVKLRHVHINGSASFKLDPERSENSSILDNLKTLSTPILTYGGDTEKILRRVRGIEKLKCVFLDSWDDATNCNKFPELAFLDHLVSLNVLYNGVRKYPCKFNFPSNLKKLTLSKFRFPWNEISRLAKLWNLEVLKLSSNAYEGERWEMGDEVFPELKYLKLDSMNVAKWSATEDNFPHLERLILNKCEQLDEIPHRIGDITGLDMIEVMWCKNSAGISAKEIKKEQLGFGNKVLKIHVHPKVQDL